MNTKDLEKKIDSLIKRQIASDKLNFKNGYNNKNYNLLRNQSYMNDLQVVRMFLQENNSLYPNLKIVNYN